METYLIYIAKVAIAAGAFYIAFLLLFQNQKHFTFNRIYLPVSLALSFMIPLITFTTVKYIEPVNFDVNSFAYLPAVSGETVQPEFNYEWYHYLFGLYLLGTAGFLFHLLLGHLKAINIIQKSRVQKIFNNLVNITQKDVHPFSFFSKIVVSEKTLSHPDLEMIISHEKIHVREKHTLDILFTEVLFLLQWFNPFAWLLKDAVKNNLEYLTDDEIAKHYNPQTYQMAMVTLADKQGIAPFLTALNGSQLKNRIVMMKKKNENKFAVVKQLAVLPILAILVMGLSNKEVKTEIVQTNQTVSASKNRFIHVVKPHNSIKGKVTDQITGSPVADARIVMEDLKIEATTDVNGNYEIEFGKNEKPLLMAVSAKKYYTNEVVYYGTNDNLNITLEKVTANSIIEKETKVTGKVTNEKGEPLIGASVFIKGKTIGTITDAKGKYEIKSEEGIEILIFAMNGYEKQEIEIGEQQEINVKLTVDKNAKPNEIVVVGYGIAKTEKSQPEGFAITGPFQGVVKQGSENTIITPSSQNGLTIKSGGDPKNHPLFVVDGTEVKSIENLNPEEIEKIEVLKDKSATAVYGDKGKNGVILITTKKQKIKWNPLVIVNGKESTQKVEDIDPGTIQSVNSLTGDAATKKYGEKGKNAVIEITLKSEIPAQDKTTGKTKSGETLFFVVDEMPEYPGGDLALRTKIAHDIKYPVIAQENGIQGKVYVSFVVAKDGKVTEPVITRGVDPALDKEALRVVSNLEKWTPGKNGGEPVNVSYTIPITFALQGPTAEHSTSVSGQFNKQAILELRSKIAQTIKYPVVAQENNQQGVVDMWAFVAKDGTISNISEKRLEGKIINIDEVVVTSYKSEKTVTSEKSKDLALLVKESKRVIEQLSPITIPELAGETVSFRIKFVLQ